MNVEKDYYEQYWRSDGQAPPESDPLTEIRIEKFIEVAKGAQSVLDLGCGNGRETRLLAPAVRHVVGLDISHRPLLKAKEDCTSSDFLQAACDAPLPFAADSFDAVYCAEVIEHLLDPAAMVAECRRVLKKSGLLFITTPYHGLVKNIAVAVVGFDKHFDVTGPHIRFFTERSLAVLLQRNAFALKNIWHLGRYWPLWMNLAVCAVKK